MTQETWVISSDIFRVSKYLAGLYAKQIVASTSKLFVFVEFCLHTWHANHNISNKLEVSYLFAVNCNFWFDSV